MKCLTLLSGKGTVNVTSSVSAITAHTGMADLQEVGSMAGACTSSTCGYGDRGPGIQCRERSER